MARTHTSRWTSAIAVAALAVASVTGTSIAADAAAPYSISGTVLGKATPSATPAPLANVAVYLGAVVDGSYDPTATSDYTDAAGHFDFDDFDLTAGTYDLWYNPCYQQTATPCDYEQGETGALTATGDDNSFVLTAGSPTTVQNITLKKAGFVSGVLRDENGALVVNKSVFAEYPNGYYGQQYGATTNESGEYTLKVRPGLANISSSESTHYNDPNETRQCYNNAYQGGVGWGETPTPLNVAIGSTTTGIDLAYSIAPSVRGQVVDAQGDGVPWVESTPFHLNETTGKFDGPRSGPYGTDGTGWWLYCPRPGETYKYVFIDRLDPAGLGDGATIARTTPVVSGWAGGTSGMRINQAPSFGPFDADDIIDAGKLTLVPFVPGSALFSLGTPRVVTDEGYPDELFVESAGVSPGDVTQSSRQWLRNGVVLAGETDYVLDIDASAEQGSEYSARLTYTRPGSPDLVVESSVYIVGGPQADEQFDVVGTPSISGGTVVGQQLSASTGSWSPNPALGYAWFRNGAAISAATSANYVLTAQDVGTTISVRVTGTKSGWVTETRESAAVGPITATPVVVDPPVVEPPVVQPPVVPGTLIAGVPTIGGTKRVGATLTADAGTWGPAPVALGYQWLRNGVPVPGAVGAQYVAVASDRGAVISVVVSGAKDGFTAATAGSAGVVIAAGAIVAKAPKVSGTAKVGKKLKAVPGTSSPAVAPSYRWYRLVGTTWKRIAGATKATYTVKSADRGHRLRVEVKRAKAGYTTVVDRSTSTAKVR